MARASRRSGKRKKKNLHWKKASCLKRKRKKENQHVNLVAEKRNTAPYTPASTLTHRWPLLTLTNPRSHYAIFMRILWWKKTGSSERSWWYCLIMQLHHGLLIMKHAAIWDLAAIATRHDEQTRKSAPRSLHMSKALTSHLFSYVDENATWKK